MRVKIFKIALEIYQDGFRVGYVQEVRSMQREEETVLKSKRGVRASI
jgi:hypothetical protein